MPLREDDVQTLEDLGLTARQANVFLVLAKLKISTARAIAVASRQPRQDVYKVLEELHQLGLVEKQLTTPTKFTASPLDETLSGLLNRSVKKASELRRRTRNLVKNLRQIDSDTMPEEGKVMCIPGGEPVILKIKKSIENSKQSIDAVSPQKYISQGYFYLAETLQKAMQRGVKIRFITCLDETNQQFSVPNLLAGNKNFENITIKNHANSRFCIYDNKEVSVVLSPNEDFSKPSILWSNCTGLVETYQDYYETLWHDESNHVRPKGEAVAAKATANLYDSSDRRNRSRGSFHAVQC